jgi:uncharacterized protein
MKRLLILSDTHHPKKKIPPTILSAIHECDYLIHLGDFQTLETYHFFASLKPIEAVHGNVDEEELQRLLPLRKIIKIEEIRIGLVHGHGTGLTTEKRVLTAFKDHNLDLICFGHSHIPTIKEIGHTILFNPGSPTDKRRQSHYSFGILEINNDQFTIKHVFFDS